MNVIKRSEITFDSNKPRLKAKAPKTYCTLNASTSSLLAKKDNIGIHQQK